MSSRKVRGLHDGDEGNAEPEDRASARSGDGIGGGGRGGANNKPQSNATKSVTGTETASQAVSLASSAETSLSQMANLDLKYKNRFVQMWLHINVAYRLLLMLVVPFAALIILLVIVISNESAASKSAQKITVLADLVSFTLLTVAQLSAEYTACLWWILDPTLNSGITLYTGGLAKVGLAGQVNLTDVRLNNLLAFIGSTNKQSVSPRLADKLAVVVDLAQGIHDVRYDVQRFRKTEAQVTDFYVPLLEDLLNIVDLTATLADSRTVREAQSIVSWSRCKTAIERERHTAGMVLLLQDFTLTHYEDWQEQVQIHDAWRLRFLSIAPDAMKVEAQNFFVGDAYRKFQELRRIGLNSFVPGNTSSLPAMDFSDWMGSATAVTDFMRDFRARASAQIVSIADSSKLNSATNLSLYIVLAILAAALSVSIGMLVGWSIHSPWNSMLRMKDRMLTKLHEQQARDVIVSQFVPNDFLTMMGLKSLFELQLGTCMLKRASLLCTVIRNFTKMSERMAPQQTFQFLSMWLQDCGPIIRRHGGFIEKFRGNGLSAVFQDPNDTLDAALELLESVQLRNQEASNASLQMELGVAVHTGDLMMGTVGDQARMETAIISEALATALQVSHLTSVYQAGLLVTRETFMVLNVEGLTARSLGEAGVHGLHTHIQTYEVLRPSDESKMDTLNEFNQAIKMHQNGEFDNAVNLYKSVLQMDPSDAVAIRRLKLAEKHEWVDLVD